MTNNSELLIVVGAFGVFLTGYAYCQSQGRDKTPQLDKKPAFKADMTLKQLQQYNGETGPEIFVALKGVIYDVSSSDFYKKPSGYAMFAGHDASISLSKMSLEADYLDQWGRMILVGQQESSLDGWVQMFQSKYPVVGRITDI